MIVRSFTIKHGVNVIENVTIQEYVHITARIDQHIRDMELSGEMLILK